MTPEVQTVSEIDPPPPQPIGPNASGEPVPAKGSFQLPADYYAAPPATSDRSGCPKWVPIGCGLGGCLVLILIFVGGSLLVRGAGGWFTPWLIGQMEQDIERRSAADVTAEDKQALHQSFADLRANIPARHLTLVDMSKFLETYRSAIADQKVDHAEYGEIIKAANDVAAVRR